MKKAYLSFLLIPLLCSCIDSFQNVNWNKFRNNNVSIKAESRSFNKINMSFNYESFKNDERIVLQYVKDGRSLKDISSLLNSVIKQQNELFLIYMKSMCIYYGNGTEENKKAFEKVNNELTAFSIWYSDFLLECSKGSKELKTYIFGDMSDEEIANELKGGNVSSKVYELKNQISSLQRDAESLINKYRNGNLKKDNYISQILDVIIDISKIEHDLSKELHIDNYMNYLYENSFYRSYTYDKVQEISSYLKKYFVPFVKNYSNPIQKSSLTTNNLSWIKKLDLINAFNETIYQGNVFNKHAKRMGGSFLKNYNHLWNYGYYCFSNSQNALGSAFTSGYINSIDDSFLFFGSNYQSALTIQHEFGHYNAIMTNKDKVNESYDIKEIHSQANEMLYLSTLVDEYKNTNRENAVKYFANEQAFGVAKTLFNLVSCAEVENYVFDNYQKEKSELLNGINSIIDSYDGLCSDVYWSFGSSSNQGYYISYVTSAINSLEIGAVASTDFEKARDSYFDLVSYSGHSKDIYSHFNEWGLNDPLKEETYKNLVDNFIYYK